MRWVLVAALVLGLVGASPAAAFEKDVLKTSAGDLEITFIGHGTLILGFGGKTIHVDPFENLADYSKLPKADIVLITHGHGDHLDAEALAAIRTPKTTVVVAPACEGKVNGAVVMHNGEERVVEGIPVAAVPAYNLEHKRPDGVPFHPKGEGNGYVLTFGDTKVLIAGDTENVPELKALKGIKVAFLPMNLPYTMTPEMVADLAHAIKPRILYPYHFGDTDPARLVRLLQGEPAIEVRTRQMR
ncbi:MAG TPA: MBL fold metallo-hydrolase [Thermoanaerobaculaceae bacterium]|nr:MBL fold metallo-hydrolase [Thermoanaerobaculaceae bacterium]HPS76943.1 MBL fold metallo-hydrolase [Thermoanaerobaculaceae bacterium]